MSLYAQPNLTSGIDDALISTAQSVPMFPIMIIVFVYIVIIMGGSSNQKRRVGVADYPFWFVLGGLAATFLALIFTLGAGLINLTVLSIIISITIMSAIWFFLSTVRGEQ